MTGIRVQEPVGGGRGSAWVTAILVVSAAATVGYWTVRAFGEEDTEAMESPLILSVARQFEVSPWELYGPFGGSNPLVLIHAPLYYRAAALLGLAGGPSRPAPDRRGAAGWPADLDGRPGGDGQGGLPAGSAGRTAGEGGLVVGAAGGGLAGPLGPAVRRPARHGGGGAADLGGGAGAGGAGRQKASPGDGLGAIRAGGLREAAPDRRLGGQRGAGGAGVAAGPCRAWARRPGWCYWG